MKKFTYFMVFTLSLSLLSACGWRLRGSGDSLELQHTIFLASTSGTVYEQIKKTLTKKNVLASIAEADIQLELGDEYFERRRASVNNQAQTTQYQLTLSMPYAIFDRNGDPLIIESRVELDRYYTFNQNAINSSNKEEQALRKEMTRQVARQILQRVNYLSRNKINTVTNTQNTQ